MRPELTQAVDLLRRNTPEAVEEAIGLLQGTVYSFSMKVCGHPQDAEDTMQEVLSRSMGHLAKIQDPQALAVWLYTVTRNRCWRMRRKGASAPKHMLSLDDMKTEQVERILDLQPGTVRVRLHRARLLVRKEMSTMLAGTPERSDKTG